MAAESIAAEPTGTGKKYLFLSFLHFTPTGSSANLWYVRVCIKSTVTWPPQRILVHVIQFTTGRENHEPKSSDIHDLPRMVLTCYRADNACECIHSGLGEKSSCRATGGLALACQFSMHTGDLCWSIVQCECRVVEVLVQGVIKYLHANATPQCCLKRSPKTRSCS